MLAQGNALWLELRATTEPCKGGTTTAKRTVSPLYGLDGLWRQRSTGRCLGWIV